MKALEGRVNAFSSELQSEGGRKFLEIIQTNDYLEISFAREPGRFTLDVFTPSSAAPHHFGHMAIDPHDDVRLSLAVGRTVLPSARLTVRPGGI